MFGSSAILTSQEGTTFAKNHGLRHRWAGLVHLPSTGRRHARVLGNDRDSILRKRRCQVEQPRAVQQFGWPGALRTARRMACESLGVKKLAIAWWMDGRCRSVRTRSRLLCHSTSCRCTQQRDEINRLSSRRLGKPRVALADDRAPDRRATSPAVDSYVAQGWRSGWWRVARDGRRTPQGAGISPMLANVFPHYVLDLWIHLQWRKRKARGRVIIVRRAEVTGDSGVLTRVNWCTSTSVRLTTFGLRQVRRRSFVLNNEICPALARRTP